MKTLIACYSFSGNTLKVAESLKMEINADLIRIEPQNDTSYLMKCINAMLKKSTPIKPCKADLTGYDALVVCSPVWAWNVPPAVNEYLKELKGCEGKKAGAIVTCGGSGNEKVMNKIKTELAKKKMGFVGSVLLKEKEVQMGSYDSSVKALAALLK
jgi:flavodoxin